MTLKLGPVLSFRGLIKHHWCVSALVVVEDGQARARIDLASKQRGSCHGQGKPLGAFPGAAPANRIWRFDLSVALE